MSSSQQPKDLMIQKKVEENRSRLYLVWCFIVSTSLICKRAQSYYFFNNFLNFKAWNILYSKITILQSLHKFLERAATLTSQLYNFLMMFSSSLLDWLKKSQNYFTTTSFYNFTNLFKKKLARISDQHYRHLDCSNSCRNFHLRLVVQCGEYWPT